MPSATRSARDWRTRRDLFGDVWDVEVVPLLKADNKRVLQATTLIELLQERHPGQFIDGQARTLQRRLRDWRAVNGPTQEVFFEQRHVAGREAAGDFTHATELGVTIRGVLLEHGPARISRLPETVSALPVTVSSTSLLVSPGRSAFTNDPSARQDHSDERSRGPRQ